MAYVNSTRSAQVSFSDRFAAILKVAKDLIDRRRVYNQTLCELRNLSDRALADLCWSHGPSAQGAHEAADQVDLWP